MLLKASFLVVAALASLSASADWVGNPIELSQSTSVQLSNTLSDLNYPLLTEGWMRTGITPMLGCQATMAKTSCNLIILSKDIAPKDCATFPQENFANKSVTLSQDESAQVIQDYTTAGFPVSNGKVSVGSYCGGLVLECSIKDSSCTAQLYSF